MEAGLDTGPVLLSAATPIADGDTAASLHDRLAGIGARLIVEALARLPLPAQPQADEGVTYAAKIDKAESAIDWSRSASDIGRQIRAFNPFPGAHTVLAGVPVKLWGGVPTAAAGRPGEVLATDRDGLVVACGEGGLRIVELQKAGGKRLPAAQFLAGHPVAVGTVFGADA